MVKIMQAIRRDEINCIQIQHGWTECHVWMFNRIVEQMNCLRDRWLSAQVGQQLQAKLRRF